MLILCTVHMQFTLLLEDEDEGGQSESESGSAGYTQIRQARLSKKDDRLIARDGRRRMTTGQIESLIHVKQIQGITFDYDKVFKFQNGKPIILSSLFKYKNMIQHPHQSNLS